MNHNHLDIYCVNTESYIPADGGDSLLDILQTVRPALPFSPICARVNNKTESLSYQVFAPKMVEFLPADSPSGQRTYTRSLCMMLYVALTKLYPEAKLCIEHSISGGCYCRLKGNVDASPEVVNALRNEMRRMVDADIPFLRHEILTRDLMETFRLQGLDDKVRLLETTHELYTVYYTLDGVADSYYGPLAPSTGILSVFDLMPYKEGFLLLLPDKADPSKPNTFVPQEKMYQAFTDYTNYNNIIGIRNVGELNKAVEERRSSDLIQVAEALHDKRIADIAEDISRRYRQGGARIVLVAGPSSSGKTTTAKRLAIYLMANLLQPRLISLDNYFRNREESARDEFGNYDFESIHTLNLERFNADLNALLAGKEIELPYYDFESGRSLTRGERIQLGPNSVLLIEGIHGLNPELTAQVEERMKYRVYVSALTTLSIDDHNWIPTTDNRLLRRLIRDHKYRGISAIETLRLWPSVRRGEEKWIFPYQENADSTFNSSLIFELGVMKEYGEALLKNVPRDSVEYAEAYRLRRFLSYFSPIDVSTIPPTSLLREFLGGSSFHY